MVSSGQWPENTKGPFHSERALRVSGGSRCLRRSVLSADLDGHWGACDFSRHGPHSCALVTPHTNALDLILSLSVILDMVRLLPSPVRERYARVDYKASCTMPVSVCSRGGPGHDPPPHVTGLSIKANRDARSALAARIAVGGWGRAKLQSHRAWTSFCFRSADWFIPLVRLPKATGAGRTVSELPE
jgi:hypothetical protein